MVIFIPRLMFDYKSVLRQCIEVPSRRLAGHTQVLHREFNPCGWMWEQIVQQALRIEFSRAMAHTVLDVGHLSPHAFDKLKRSFSG